MKNRNRAMRAALSCVLFLAMAADAVAATVTVISTDDTVHAGDGKVTLREAITAINTGGDLGDPDIAAQNPGTFGANPDTIAFDIAGSGVRTIHVQSPLPTITSATLIDGYTQPGASPNSLSLAKEPVPDSSNAVLLIELDGSQAGAGANGLASGPNACCDYVPPLTIRGLAIGGFDGAGIKVGGRDCVDPNQLGCTAILTVTGNYIGTDASGAVARPNGIGIDVAVAGTAYIGGEIPGVNTPSQPPPASRNVISGNRTYGVRVDAAPGSLQYHNVCSNCFVEIYGGYIGVDASGTKALGNGSDGVHIGVEGSARILYADLIGGNGGDGVSADLSPDFPNNGSPYTTVSRSNIGAVGLGNAGNGLHFHGNALGGASFVRIIGNGGAGIRVEDNALADFSSGAIDGNGSMAIDIGAAGPTANNSGVAANQGLNFPVLASAVVDNGSLRILGSYDGPPNAHISVYFYRSNTCDASGRGQASDNSGGQLHPEYGASFINVTTDANGHAGVSQQQGFPAVGPIAYPYLSAVARYGSSGGIIVSEFSPCVLIEYDQIFSDGFDSGDE